MLMRKLCTIIWSVVCSFPTKGDEKSSRSFLLPQGWGFQLMICMVETKCSPNTVLIFSLMSSTCADDAALFSSEKGFARVKTKWSCHDHQLSIPPHSLLIRSRRLFRLINFMSGWKFYGEMCFVSFNIVHLLAGLKTCPIACWQQILVKKWLEIGYFRVWRKSFEIFPFLSAQHCAVM